MSKKVIVISSDVESYEIARRMAKVTQFELVFVNSIEKLQWLLNGSKESIAAVHFDVDTSEIDHKNAANLFAMHRSQIPIVLNFQSHDRKADCFAVLSSLTYKTVQGKSLDELANSLKTIDVYCGFLNSEQQFMDWAEVRDGNDELVFQSAAKASKNDFPVLIEGAIGTPKAEMAKSTHKLSNRYRNPMRIIDAGMYSAEELAIVIFGDEISNGLLHDADCGTLFINNLNQFSDELQDRITNFLDSGSVYSEKDNALIKLDVRLMIATDLDLINEVKSGALREALYYRLSVSPIMMNKFSSIAADMHGWIETYIFMLKSKIGHENIEIEQSALDVLAKFTWPGNHRQFFQALAWTIGSSDDDILRSENLPYFLNMTDIFTGDLKTKANLAPEMSDLITDGQQELDVEPKTVLIGPTQYLNMFDDTDNMRSICDVEEELIRRAIAYYDGKMSFVAKQLGIGRSTLYRKLKEYEIDPDCPLELVS